MNNPPLKLTILGCGNSSGVPSIGNYWGNCDPAEPKNRRLRCSLAVQSEKTTLIVDTGPNFQDQMNMHNIFDLDYVLYSHHHSDHINGIDDLRPLYFRGGRKKIDIFASQESLSDLETRFHYLFKGGNNEKFYPEILHGHAFAPENYHRINTLGDIEFIPFPMDHGTCMAVGYRFGDLSYCVDMKALSDAVLQTIKGSKIWIVDGAGYKNPDNAVHVDLETLYRYNEIVEAEQVYISCLSPQMDYETLRRELPDGFFPAYDGLSFSL
ncbi:MAG: MBL fold metallo-hydrolase [Alphaproteobacteria bacterium]|nr:MBL fold metallo-hydrolase [Alphaproteobacteria bacterium]